MTDLVQRLRGRKVPHWRHATGETPEMGGLKPDAECVEAADEIERLQRDGPMMQRAIAADGSVVMGTMRECLDDALSAAFAEARHADKLRSEIERLDRFESWLEDRSGPLLHIEDVREALRGET